MQTFRDIYRYQFVLSTLVAKDLKALYRNMALGFFWSMLQPFVMVAVLSFVLVSFFGQGWEAPAKVVVGIIPFNYFSYCISACTISITCNSSLVKRVAFPRQILPFAVIVTNLVHYAIQFVLLVAVLIVFKTPGSPLSLNLLWMPLILVTHIGLCLGAGFLVAGLNVVYRDVQYIVESTITVLFWLSPCLYDASVELAKAPIWAKYLYYANPVSGLLHCYRSVLYHGRSPELAIVAMTLVATLAIGYLGVRQFWVHEKSFADLIA